MKEPKLKTVYVCSNCGETSPRWMGRCPSCGSWNTMNEDVVAEAPKAGTTAARQAAAARQEGMTMMVVTHEMAFAREVANRVLFFSEGNITEEGKPEDVFGHPKSERLQQFLASVL